MSVKESKIEKDIRMLLKHQNVGLSEKENAVYKICEELEKISRKTFYLLLKTDKMWKACFTFAMALSICNIVNIIWVQVPWFDQLINRIIGPIAGIILIMNIFIIPLFYYLLKDFKGKSLVNKFKEVLVKSKEILLFLSYPCRYFSGIILLSITFSSLEFYLYDLILSFADEKIKAALYIMSLILLINIFIHTIREFLSLAHKKWIFLSISNMFATFSILIFCIIILPVLSLTDLNNYRNKLEILCFFIHS